MTTWTQSMDGTLPGVLLKADGYECVSIDDLDRISEEDTGFSPGGYILFQHGPIAEVGKNGTTIETLIGALVNRLEGFQHGPFANDYNAEAITYLRLAKDRLEARTRDRQARGVEGRNLP